MRVVCTLEILNRRAVAHGQSGRNKPSKVVIQLKGDYPVKPFILVSSNKDLVAHQYLVENIKNIRKNFLHEGKITIELREPEINLMLRDASVEDLNKFLVNLSRPNANPTANEVHVNHPPPKLSTSKIQGSTQSLPERRDDSPKIASKTQDRPKMPNTMENFLIKRDSPSTSSSISISTKRKASIDESRINDVNIEKEQILPSQKRARPGDETDKPLDIQEKSCKVSLRRNEVTAIRRALKNTNKEMKVLRREDYPYKGFSRELQNLVMHGILVRKIDSRLLELKNLKILNLSENRITSIDCMISMDSCLSTLVLNNNCIERIPDDFFCYPSVKMLTFLSLADNKLTTIPRSIVKLENLQSLVLSKNNLKFLPYNIHNMRSLGTLSVNGNGLTFLPSTIQMLRLTRLDVSNNDFQRGSASIVRKVQLDEFPTLFEIAAGCVQTQNRINRQKKEKLLYATHTDVPSIVYDMLESCKYCVQCGRMVARYTFRDITTFGNLAQEVVGIQNVQNIPMRKAFCDKCGR